MDIESAWGKEPGWYAAQQPSVRRDLLIWYVWRRREEEAQRGTNVPQRRR